MKRNYEDYVNDILSSINAIQDFTRGMNDKEFKSDLKTIYAVTKAIEIIGEAAKKIPRRIREKNPEIPWTDIIGMRNKLSHEYFGIDWKSFGKPLRRISPYLRLNLLL